MQFFCLLFTAQPGTPNKSADCFHCNITGKKLLCLNLYATCLAQHQNETWMNGLTKSLKDFHVPFCLPPHKGAAHLNKSYCNRTNVKKITTVLSCSITCHHKFILRWREYTYSEWMGGSAGVSFQLLHLRLIFSMCWKLKYYQTTSDLIKVFLSEILPSLFCHFPSFLKGWHFSALRNY